MFQLSTLNHLSRCSNEGRSTLNFLPLGCPLSSRLLFPIFCLRSARRSSHSVHSAFQLFSFSAFQLFSFSAFSLILFVTDLFHPFNNFTVKRFLNGDMSHR